MTQSLSNILSHSQNILMEYWPLNAFIATNPLWDLRHKPFSDVIAKNCVNGLMSCEYYLEQYKQNKITDTDIQAAITEIEGKKLPLKEIKQWVNHSIEVEHTSRPHALFTHQLDEIEFQNPIDWVKERICPTLRDYFGQQQYRQTDLLSFWYAQHHTQNSFLQGLRKLSIQKAINQLVNTLNIPSDHLKDYFESIYIEVYGWASLMKWRMSHADNPWIPGKDDPSALLLFWLSMEYLAHKKTNQQYHPIQVTDVSPLHKSNLNRRYIWQSAFENHYLNELNSKFNKKLKTLPNAPDAQFIFCIDTRSEGFRRHLEKSPNIETFGFAGFFGVIFNVEEGGHVAYQAPALVCADQTLKTKTPKTLLSKLHTSFSKLMKLSKPQLSAPFALFEIAGSWFLPYMLYKSIIAKFTPSSKSAGMHIKNTLDQETQYQAATNLLNSIGLNQDFAKHVLICAHQSDNVNNPFKASLNCGACGGNSGIPNALIMCDILNSPAIRQKLQSEANINIPTDTQFIPACHHTCKDRLEILRGNIPDKLESTIEHAASGLRAEKTASLPTNKNYNHREKSWSELIPELGLINNTAIIIAPRALTIRQNLDRRTFLHSYEPSIDKDGAILTSILSAPAVVAHWISSQYYFSTVNPNTFGAGNKAIHNVLPGVGVLEGNMSDLKIGLPSQSTHFQSKPIHEPRRLTVVVYAKKEILDKAINQSPEFKTLLENGWIHLKAINASA